MKKLLIPHTLYLIPLISYSQFWSDVGGGVGSGNVVETMHIHNNELYVGGGFTYIGGVFAYTIAKWNGLQWDSVGTNWTWPGTDSNGVGGPLDMETFNGELYVVDYLDAIRKWNGNNWCWSSCLSQPNSGVQTIEYKNDLYVGGWFDTVGNTRTRRIAAYNGTNWYEPGGGVYQLINLETIVNFEVYKNRLIACGGLYRVGWPPMRVNLIASWDGQKWDSLAGGMYGGQHVRTLEVDTINDFLYAGGTFGLVWNRGVADTAYMLARWDGFRWAGLKEVNEKYVISPFGPYDKGLKMYHGKLYAGGSGQNKDTTLYTWDGKTWELVNGAPNYAIVVLEEWKDSLFVGGGFDTAGGQKVNYIARYYAPWDTNCNFLQPLIYALSDSSKWYTYSDTFYISNNDSVQVFFYNNIKSSSFWQWDFGDGDTGSGKTPAHYYTAAGTYTVSVIVNYPYGPYGPCIDTAYRVITVINNTGVNELQNKPKFKIYPNPAKREITVELQEARSQKSEGKYIVRIKNSLGQKIYEQKFQKKLVLNTSGFKQGIYLIEVCTAEGVVCHTEKVVIE